MRLFAGPRSGGRWRSRFFGLASMVCLWAPGAAAQPQPLEVSGREMARRLDPRSGRTVSFALPTGRIAVSGEDFRLIVDGREIPASAFALEAASPAP